MFFTLFTVALFVAASIRGVSAGFAINSPQLVQCKTSKVSWEPTSPPYNVIVTRASDMCGEPLVEIGDFYNTSTQWTVKIPSGTEVYISVVDSKEEEAWSNKITVGPSSDASCLTGSGSSRGSPSPSNPPAGSPPSPSPSPSTSISPLGAANAGTLGSSAITGRQASMPVLAIAGLAVVVALL
jgi:hypothetical protein